MKKPLSDKEILVNTICNNMREIITNSADTEIKELAALIIGHLTSGSMHIKYTLDIVLDELYNIEIYAEFSYSQYIAQVTTKLIDEYREN